MRINRIVLGFAVLSVLANALLMFALADLARISSDVEAQHRYQMSALEAGELLFRKVLVGKSRGDTAGFLKSAGIEYYDKAEEIEVAGYLIEIEREVVVDVNPMGW